MCIRMYAYVSIHIHTFLYTHTLMHLYVCVCLPFSPVLSSSCRSFSAAASPSSAALCSLALVEVWRSALDSLHLNGRSLEGPWASLEVLGRVLGGPCGRIVSPEVALET